VKSRNAILLRFPARDSHKRVSFRTLKRLAAVLQLALEDTIHHALAEFARKTLKRKRLPAFRIRKKAARRRG
jgi:hypothetical protein